MGRARAQPWAGYLLAVLLTALALLTHQMLTPILGTTHYDVFYLSVALAAILWGQGPGLLAAVLGTLVSIWLFALHSSRADFLGGDQVLHLLSFLGLGSAISLVAGRLRTQRQHVEQQRELLAVTLASIGDGVVATDLEGRVIFVNGEAERLTGWTNQDAVGQPAATVFRTVHEQPPQPLVNLANMALPQEPIAGGPSRPVLLAKDGREIPLEVNSATIRGAEGEIQGEVLVFRDRSAQKTAQEALREAVELRQIALDTAAMGTWELDPKSLVLVGDARCQAILGLSSERFHHPQFLDRLHPEDRPRVDRGMQATLTTPATDGYALEYRVVHADGSVRWVAAKGRNFFQGEGETRRLVRVVGMVMDITEQKQAEEKLRASEEMLQQAIRVSGLGIFDHDLRTNSLNWSSRVREMLGADQEEPPSIQRFLARVHPEDRPRVAEAIERGQDPHSDGLHVFECRALHPDGTVRWLNFWAQTTFEGEGESRRPVRVIGMVMDLTDRKEAEEELRASEELLQLAVRSSGLGVFDHDQRTDTFHWSPRLREIRGFGPEEPASIAAFLERIHPDDRSKVAEAIRRGHDPAGDGLHTFECRVVWPDGTVRWNIQRGQTFFEGEGPARRPVRTVGVVTDITERKRAEEKLRASEELFRAFFDSAAVGTCLAVGPGGRFLQVNDRFCEITGYSREELLQMTPADLFHPDDRLRDLDRLAGLLPEQLPTSELEQRHVRKDGTIIWVQVNVSPIYDREGHTQRVAGIIQDITERKAAEEALAAARQNAEQAQAAAEAANQAKSQFLAHMSHELRTPMNAILGMTELALQEALSPLVRDYLQTVKDSADTLLALINEVLDLSRIEAGVLRLESSPFRLRSLVDDTLKAVSFRAFEKSLELACHVAPEVPDQLLGDPLRLRQILTNLLGNAIKFTEHGEIVVQVGLEAETPEEVRLRFAVADTGIGIAPEHQQHIFAPFTQADPSMTRRFGGCGLGLSIVTRLVTMLGGQVELESQPGLGSTFSFTAALRRQAGLPPDPQRLILEQFKDLSVLVADHHAINRRILQQILTGWAMRPILVQDVSEALTQLHAATDAGGKIPLAILDVSMSGMEELQPLKQLHADERLKAAAILTASPAERQRLGRQPDLPDRVVFLEKPITPVTVVSALAEAMGVSSHEERPSVYTPPVTVSRSLRVLLAEDSPANQKLAIHILRRRGHAVQVVTNGQEALERLSREPFDVVLMDVQMPVMDGFQATTEIRKMHPSHTARIPIIAMTAHALKGDQEQCLSAGMDAYISKPINGQELITLVEQTANRSPKRGGPPDTAGPPFPERSAEEASPPPAPLSVEFDLDEGVRRCFGKYTMFQDMVACFFDEVDQLVEQMHSALAQGDGDETYRAAHRLKNTVVYLGASRAAEAIEEVERHCRSGDLAAASHAFEELEHRLASLKPVLAEYRRKAK